MRRRYPETPIAAVSGVVFDAAGCVLLARRGRAPAKDKWSFPGGVVHVGEDLENALRREVREETGLDVDVKSLLDVSSRILRDDDGRVAYHYILLDYLCSARTEDVRAGSDVREAAWVPVDRLSEYDTTEDAERVIRKGLDALREGMSF